jgi:hypothetical protein
MDALSLLVTECPTTHNSNVDRDPVLRHLVKALPGKRFQIGNNRGRINGWVGENNIFGKCIRIE